GVRARNGEMARHVVEIVNCSDVTLDGLTISGGGASGPGANDPNGGGLYVAGSRGAVNRCVITQNIAQAKGGGAYVADSILSWDRCLFLANASPAGGGLFHVASRVQLDTCCFIDNWAGSAHSIQGVTSHAALLNSTLASSQDSTAPELVNQEATTVIVNSIVWSSASPALSGAGFDARHSNIRGFSGGTEVMDADPLFVDIEALDVHLGAASPCIDKGDALYAARPDWEGRARPQRRGTDLGAYEFPGNVVYVDERSSALVKTGASWATALTGVQEGIEKAYATGGEVWVAQGFYYWNGAQPDAGAFVLRPGVDVYGGFSGRETARDQRNVSRHATVLYGVNPGSGTAATHVITGANDTILDGLYIQGGDARGKSAPSGGGLYVWHMSMTLRDCVFSNNKASRGGALSADSSNINLSRCVFENNMATQTGGGVGIRWSNLRAIDCVFRGCEASDGGGIWSENSEIAFRKCFFEGNRAQGAGFLGGGAIGASTGTDLLAIACEFTGNIAPAGGVLACEEMALFMANCIAYDNEAGTAGGVLYSMGFVSGTLGEPRILGCTFYGNKGLMGSAYYSTNGPLPLSENTIVWGNGPDVVVGDAPFRYSIVQQSEPGPGNLNESPLFVDPSNGDFRILEDSPARDSAARADELTGTVPREATSVDIRNVPKPQGSGPDMGAYEFAESDSDGDGIFDEMEGDEDPDQDGIANYLDFDSDNDGLDDRLERSLGLDPYDASDADADPDSDGLSTRDEALLHHTNPFVADTDGGGVKDGDEIRLGRNPLSPHDDNPYDVNVDGQVDAIDVQLVINGALRISVPFHTDVNLDGATDALDVQMVINAALRLM
ncbi:MAG TPA: choice-of-anchor Q domain-containing protein, partial [Candidatus Hydrogenedentes bacterium]|nr:choice-of-anchor Q domain-containing protein [Candidatus Hydrogenedentota bacterium]